jgi:chorismate mutase
MDRIEAEGELTRLRDAIDRVDEVIVRLLNQRARYAIQAGEIKGLLNLPIYAPEREKEVLWRAEQSSEGPLGGTAVRRLFERIIDESRRVEREAASEGVKS